MCSPWVDPRPKGMEYSGGQPGSYVHPCCDWRRCIKERPLAGVGGVLSLEEGEGMLDRQGHMATNELGMCSEQQHHP